ncbi:MAG TPA: ankyrin repeat domain-containing protein [Burkholderiaceae bacterium]|nr:ankyrin repeat domain-containing protein [Burkholderiaceae bacterium]
MNIKAWFHRTLLLIMTSTMLLGLMLSTHGVRAQEVDNSDWWVAIANDRADVVKRLLEDGADANAVGTSGQPPIMFAIREGAWEVYDILLRHPDTAYNAINVNRETPLMYLAVIGETERAQDIIRRGAMVNRPGWTPLHYAASTGKVDTTKMLLEHGADVDARSPDGTTPLMMAAYSGSEAVVRLLLDAGADVHLRTAQDYNVVDWAGFKQHTRLGAKLQSLIDHQLGSEGASAVFDDGPAQPDTTSDKQQGGTSRYFDLDRFNDDVTP